MSAQTGVSHSEGWWNSINGGDFDHDGDVDYLLGNLGLNSSHKASPEEPVCLYVYDFNQDQRADPILCRYIQGKNFPIHPLDDMVSQMNTFKKTFTTYNAYAQSNLEDIFPPDLLKKARLHKAHTFQSIYLENLGQARFRMHTLPTEAQFAPIYGIQVNDYDADGHLDALLLGNSFAPEVLSGRYDAHSGLVLKGNGKGGFQPKKGTKTGLYVNKDGKSLSTLTLVNGQKLLLAACNDHLLKAFQIQDQKSANLLRLAPDDAVVEVYDDRGRTTRWEAYYGEGYLSQSSRSFSIPRGATKLIIRDYRGNSRLIMDW